MADPGTDWIFKGSNTQVVLAGATSGLISRFFVAPLDVIKIRLQLHFHSITDPISRGVPQTPTGIALIARDIFRNEGITGFWKGNVPAEGLYLSYGATQFLAYRLSTKAIQGLADSQDKKVPGAVQSFVAGAVAGTAATTITYPFDLLRTRFAAQGTERVYDGILASLRDITRTEGYKGFFRGLSAAVSQIVPSMGLFFAFYEGLKPPCNSISLPFGSGDALAGVTASVLSKSAVYPLDTVRKRLQVQGPSRTKYVGGSRIPIYERGVLHTLAEIIRKEGMTGIYRGLTVSLIKAAPASAVTMWTYERAIHMLMDAEKKVLDEQG